MLNPRQFAQVVYSPSGNVPPPIGSSWSDLSHSQRRNADHVFRAWDDITTPGELGADTGESELVRRFPERFVKADLLRPGARGFRVREGHTVPRLGHTVDGKLEVYDMTPMKGSVRDIPEGADWSISGGEVGGHMSPLVEVAGSRRPLDFVYRAISEEDYSGIMQKGYMHSDGRMNLSPTEGTVMSSRSTGRFYLPRNGVGRIARIKYDPRTMRRDTDDYVKTNLPIHLDQIDEFSGPIHPGQ